MSRSLKKGPFVDPKLMKRVEAQKQKGSSEPLKTWCRACVVPPDFVGHTFNVHNGRKFVKVFVTEEMVGHKLGEFSPTRSYYGHNRGEAKEGASTPATPAKESKE